MEVTKETLENPLTKFSLTGQGNLLVEQAAKPEPLLGNVCLRGEVSVWYAPPNTGKTLIVLSLVTDAVSKNRLDASKVYYVNADDSASGLAAKVQIADDFGIHCLAPGRQGFELAMLVPALRKMARDDTAEGMLVIVDTLKKVADLMSKSECREFGKAVREFAMAGGTFVGLAHTNKSRAANQKLIHAGTTDIIEDFDSAYLIDVMDVQSSDKQRVVRFECIKNRGPNASQVMYRYSTEKDLTYLERLATVQETDPVYGANEPKEDGPDALIVCEILKAIKAGINTKMAIAAEVRNRVNISRRKVLRVLEDYTGDNWREHHWNFERRERGAHSYFLLERPDSQTASD